MDFKNSAAVVAGGASGLGAATVRRLVAAGASVVVFDRNGALGKELASSLVGNVDVVEGDVADPDVAGAAVALANADGGLRVAVNCAGIGFPSRTVNRAGDPHDMAGWDRVLRTNLTGTFNVMRLAAAAMGGNEPGADGERGVIVNTASIAAFDGQAGQIAYAASKAGIAGMTLPAARDLAPLGIRVCTIAPGTMDTPLLAEAPPEKVASLAAGNQFPKRLGQPDDFATLVMHIVENGYLNGETIRLDAGQRMPPRIS